MTSFYITTAIDYPNGRPHLGHAYEKIIADALARWHKLKGEDVFFLTGTDDNSQTIPETAKAKGQETKSFLEKNVLLFRELCHKLNLDVSRFIRTTEPHHWKLAQDIFSRVHAKGDIYKGQYEGYYCTRCERYYTEKELEDKKCPTHKISAKTISEENYFFKLSTYQGALLRHLQDNPSFIQPEHTRNEILNRLKEPLRDLSISRPTTEWGVPLPIDKNHVMYVWFDALINYLSGIDYPGDTYKKFWPAVHIIGKDIAWFHTVIWPIMLMAADIPLPRTVHAHGFVNLKGEKLSKSRGIVVDPLTLIDQYGSDALRYYLLRSIPSGQDGDFSEQALIERANADLADALGNLVNRACVMLNKYCGGKLLPPNDLRATDQKLADSIAITYQQADKLMETFEWHRAAETIWKFIHAINRYVNETEPWKIQDDSRRQTVLYVLGESLRHCAKLVEAFIPDTGKRIEHALNFNGTLGIEFSKKTTGSIAKRAIVFEKIEKRPRDPFSSLNLKVAIVKQVDDHPNADKLYVLTVQADTQRTIVAGIKPYYSKEDLLGKHIIIVSNLKPAKLRGVESQGMLLAAEKDDRVVLLEAPNSPAGEQVVVDSIVPQDTQITYDIFSEIALFVKNNEAVYAGKVLHTAHESVRARIGDGAKIR